MTALIQELRSFDIMDWCLLGATGILLGGILILVMGVALCFSIAMIV